MAPAQTGAGRAAASHSGLWSWRSAAGHPVRPETGRIARGAPIGEGAFRRDHLAEMPSRRLAEREDAVVVSQSRDLGQEGRSPVGAQACLSSPVRSRAL